MDILEPAAAAAFLQHGDIDLGNSSSPPLQVCSLPQTRGLEAQILDQLKQVRFQQPHTQGLHQLFLMDSCDLRAKHVTLDDVLVYLEFQKQHTHRS